MEKKKEFYIERSNNDGSYDVISRHKTYDEAENALKMIKSDLRHSVWHKHWVNTEGGYAPMAWIN